MDIPPEPNKVATREGQSAEFRRVGLGPSEFPRTDILSAVQQHVNAVVGPHLEANVIR